MLNLIEHIENYCREAVEFDTETGYITFDPGSCCWTVRTEENIEQCIKGQFKPDFDMLFFEELREVILEDAAYCKLQVADAERLFSMSEITSYLDKFCDTPDLRLVKPGDKT